MISNPKAPSERPRRGPTHRRVPYTVRFGGEPVIAARLQAGGRCAPGPGLLLAITLGLGLGVRAPRLVYAQDGGDESGVIYRQRTVYSFEGDTIDGDLMRPDGAYIEARKEIQHSNLIQVRDSFREKVLESVVHL